MSIIKILKGLKSNLPSIKTEGTIYITTDKPNAYIDIDNSTRISLLPDLTTEDNGKFLRASNGKWIAEALPEAENLEV